MRLIKPSIEFISATPNPLQVIENAGRTCHKSEDKITPDSTAPFIEKLLNMGHLAMIEHAWASYRVICDRGVTHEIVRHRLFSYAQESTRYCNYKDSVTFVIPPWVDLQAGYYDVKQMSIWMCGDVEIQPSSDVKSWLNLISYSECCYRNLILIDMWSPQQARSVLPNALKTEIVITGNLREWLHFFKLRTAIQAHPQMREVACMLLVDIRSRIPIIFNNLLKGD